MKTVSSSGRCRAILAEMGQIPLIVPGKVCERRDPSGKLRGWKLQRWHHGQNETRHIPADLLDRVREGTVGYKRFEGLADEFTELRCQEVLGAADTAGRAKKKPMRP